MVAGPHRLHTMSRFTVPPNDFSALNFSPIQVCLFQHPHPTNSLLFIRPS